MMRRLEIVIALAGLMIAALAVPSLAAADNPYEQQILQARYDSVCARVGFTTGVMTDIVSLVPRASDLNAHIEKLNADLSTLNGYVAAGDSAGFNSFVTGTIQPDMQAAHQAMAADRTHFKEWNVTAETRQALAGKYQGRKAALDAQVQAVTLELGHIRLAHYNDALAKCDGQMARLSGKGVEVSGLQAVADSARADVITPLQNAMASGNAVQVRTELKDRCLGNGAPYSYHFWAKKDLAALGAITARIADNATQAGYGDDIAGVSAMLAAAQSALDSAGTGPYTAGQQDTIWINLKAAAEELKTIIIALGGQ